MSREATRSPPLLTVRVFFELAKRGYRRFAAYPMATFAGAFTNIIIGFLRAYVLMALFRQRATIGGYDESDAVTYVWLTQGLVTVVYLWTWNEVAGRIRTGDIAVDLVRPYPLLTARLALDFGRACYHTVFRALPPVVIGMAVFNLQLPGLSRGLVFLVSVVLAVTVSFGFRFLYNLASFWVIEYRGVALMSLVLMMFFSGFVIPTNFFPPALSALASALPFRAMLQIPVDIFVGRVSGVAVAMALAAQALWAMGLLGIGHVALQAGVRKVVVQGG